MKNTSKLLYCGLPIFQAKPQEKLRELGKEVYKMYYRMTSNRSTSYLSSLRKCVDTILTSSPHEILLKDNRTIILDGKSWNENSRAIKRAFSANKNKVAVNTDNGVYFVEGME